MAGDRDEIVEEHRDREQREPGDEHAGDGAGAEGEGEPLLQTALRGGGGADVGADRDVHPDEASDAREDRTDNEADHRNDAEKDPDQNGDDDADDGDGGVLALEIGLCAFLDGAGDFLHSLIARARAQDLAAGDEAIDDGQQSQQNRYQYKVHEISPSRLLFVRSLASVWAHDREGISRRVSVTSPKPERPWRVQPWV